MSDIMTSKVEWGTAVVSRRSVFTNYNDYIPRYAEPFQFGVQPYGVVECGECAPACTDYEDDAGDIAASRDALRERGPRISLADLKKEIGL
jgi:hypothetical protein